MSQGNQQQKSSRKFNNLSNALKATKTASPNWDFGSYYYQLFRIPVAVYELIVTHRHSADTANMAFATPNKPIIA